MNKEVWLIRHAESQANAGEVTKDVSSIELTQKGWNQAKNLVKVFSDKSPELIIMSPF